MGIHKLDLTLLRPGSRIRPVGKMLSQAKVLIMHSNKGDMVRNIHIENLPLRLAVRLGFKILHVHLCSNIKLTKSYSKM